jgi:hypothetical protein
MFFPLKQKNRHLGGSNGTMFLSTDINLYGCRTGVKSPIISVGVFRAFLGLSVTEIHRPRAMAGKRMFSATANSGGSLPESGSCNAPESAPCPLSQ